MSFDIGSVVAKVTADVSDFEEKMSNVSKKVGDVSKGMGDLGKGLTKNLTAPIVGLGGAFVATAMKSENAMAQIGRRTGLFGEELWELQDSAMNILKTVPNSMAEVATVTAELNAGLSATGDTLEAIAPNFLDIIRLQDLNSESAMPTMMAMMNALDVTAEESIDVLDKLSFAYTESGVSAEQMANYIIDAGPAFKNLGYDVDRSIALFGQFAKVGARPEEVISSLGIAINSMVDEGIEPSAEGFEKMLHQIRDATTETEALDLANQMFGRRAGAKVSEDIRAGTFEIDEFAKAIANSQGHLVDVAAETETFTDSLNRMKNRVLPPMIDLGNMLIDLFIEHLLPFIEQAIEKFTEWTEAFFALDDQTQKIILAVVGFLAVLGPVLIILAKIIGVVKTVIGVGVFLAKTVGTIIAIVAKVTALFNPLTLAIVAVIAIIVGLAIAIHKNWDWILENTENFRLWMVELFEKFREFVEETFRKIGAFVVDTFEAIRDRVSEALESIGAFIFSILDSIRDFFVDWGNRIRNFVVSIFTRIFNFYKNIFTRIFNLIRSVLNTIRSVWTNTFNFLRGFATRMFERIVDRLTNFRKSVQNVASKFFEILTNPFSKALERITQIAQNMKDRVTGLLDFTKRHSPSVLDIVKKGVNLVTHEFENLNPEINSVAGAIGSGVGASGGGGHVINIDLSGAMISSERDADLIAERVGNKIISNLRKSKKF